MQTIRLSISINAAGQTVWNSLLNHINSRGRVADFSVTRLAEGSQVVKQTACGTDILCRVVRYTPDKIISIEQEVILNKGEADYWHPEAKNWIGLYEIYRLFEEDEHTVLYVEMDSCCLYTNWTFNNIEVTIADIKMRSEQMAA